MLSLINKNILLRIGKIRVKIWFRVEIVLKIKKVKVNLFFWKDIKNNQMILKLDL